MDDQRDRRRGIVDRVNSAINTAQNLRNAVRLARTAVTVGRTAAAAAATSEIWIPVVIIIVIVLIILFALFILLGHGSGTALNSQGGQGAEPAPIGGGNTNARVTCPVPGGTVSTPSYAADPATGHCGTSYGTTTPPCIVPYSRRAQSIDVPTGGASGSDIVLPMVEGKTMEWTLVKALNLNPTDCSNPVNGSCGIESVFVSDLGGGKNWVLFLGHIGLLKLQIWGTYSSGTVVGKSAIDHVHISIGKDVPDPTSFPPGSSDTRPGWLAADKDLGTCVAPNAKSNSCTQQYEGIGDCSVVNLSKYFDPDNALIASLICQAESGSDPFATNDNCETNDYSVGLFQINAVAHCAGAYGAGSWGNQSCDNLLSIQKRNVCENNWHDPVQNILKAKEIFESWGGWTAWGTWANAGKNPPVKDILIQCGISN